MEKIVSTRHTSLFLRNPALLKFHQIFMLLWGMGAFVSLWRQAGDRPSCEPLAIEKIVRARPRPQASGEATSKQTATGV